MSSTTPTARLTQIAMVLALLFATLIRAADAPDTVSTDDLGGDERYLTYLSTDKPIYRPGETVYLRSVILNASDNTPSRGDRASIEMKIRGPKGDEVHEGYARGDDGGGAVGYRWTIPADMPGGQYTASATSPSLGAPAAERVFDIRAFRAPRIKSQIQFTRDGYGPGDEVRASMSIERAEGGVPVGASVTAIARVDGREIYRGAAQTIGERGVIDTAFALPAEIATGDGSLSFLVEDGGVVETASKTLPILLRKIDMAFYPEGGELVAGLQNRVYFQALLANGKPADVAGQIVELDGAETGRAVAKFNALHEGRGHFSFTPEPGLRYAAVFSAPAGIVSPAELPAAIDSGAVIGIGRATFDYADPIELHVASIGNRAAARVTLHKREILLDNQAVSGNVIALDGGDAEGVLIATAWDRHGQPLAERLIYRKPRYGLNVELQLSQGPYVPGASVGLDILTTDDNGNPVEAVVGLTVTDDTVLELIDKREQAPALPVMVYLENEVLDLADAHVYLDDDNPIAGDAIDLLLGTQGWRRFVLADYQNIKKQFPAASARAMAQASRPRPEVRFRQLQQLELARAAQIDLRMMAAAPRLAADAKKLNAPNVEVELEEATPVAAEPAMAPPAELDDADEAALGNGVIAADLARMRVGVGLPRPVNTGYIREFAYQTRPDRKPNDRVDFTETLYWNSGVKTGARDGRASVKFSLSDSVTTFRVLADGYARNGALGSGSTVFASLEPFYVSAKVPLHAIAADVIELPVTLVNTTADTISDARVSVSGDGIDSVDITGLTLEPGARLRSIVRINADAAGKFSLTINAQAGPYRDTLTRTLTVQPAGFPVSVNEGGLLSADKPFAATVDVPADVAAGSMIATAKVYPSPLASMQEALNALLREPHGCFEQTSSTNYPLVMAQQYFDSHTGIDPAVIARSRSLLKTGYGKLISFESEGSGYEWFGANPAHEALTAYGLMEFTDMAKVMPVDDAMIERTRRWLLDRRDGKGGFKRNEKALDSFGRAPAATTDAYIVWSLLESGQNPRSLAAEIEAVKRRAFDGRDSYIDALAANILFLADDAISANLLLEKLAGAANDAGAVEGSTTSITGSGGDALTIETTSLALLAWLRNDEAWAAQVEESIKWLFERSKSGRFGSTQSTVLALKAINAYDAARAVPKQPGSVQLYVDGEPIGRAVSFGTESKGAIELPDFSSQLSAGQHRIELRMADGSKMPFALDIRYHTPLPSNADTTPVVLATTLSHARVPEGEPVELQATISAGQKNVPTPIAIIGIPAGLELRHEQLKELVGADRISAYEVRDSELILYWRALKAGEQRVVPIGLTATVPGSYTAPASRVYPYYTDEQKLWVAGHAVEVVAQ